MPEKGDLLRMHQKSDEVRSNLDWNDCYISFKGNLGNSFNLFHYSFAKKEVKFFFSNWVSKKKNVKLSQKETLFMWGKIIIFYIMNDFFEKLRYYNIQNINFIKSYLGLVKLQNALATFIFFVLGLSVENNLINFKTDVVKFFVVVMVSYSYCSIFNDINDIKIDKINSPKRPLPSGKISLKLAEKLLYINLLIVIIVGFLFGINYLFLGLIYITVGYLYSSNKKRISDKGYFGLVLLTIAYYVLPYIFALSIKQKVSASDYLIFLSLILMGSSRLLLKDFKDMKGDLTYKKITPLLISGASRILKISFLLYVFGALLLLFCFTFFLKKEVLILSLTIYFFLFTYFFFKMLNNLKHNLKREKYLNSISRLNIIYVIILTILT
jgi:geranylgeranylglycerol-phosphate geranylgeranyltransferase